MEKKNNDIEDRLLRIEHDIAVIKNVMHDEKCFSDHVLGGIGGDLMYVKSMLQKITKDK